MKWTIKEWSGPKQFMNDSLGEELMMLPTDMALIDDPEFRKWVERYADDKELFYDHFSKAFAKLIELGVDRSGGDPYESAPKKDNKPGAPGVGDDDEAAPLKEENEKRGLGNASSGCPVHRPQQASQGGCPGHRPAQPLKAKL